MREQGNPLGLSALLLVWVYTTLRELCHGQSLTILPATIETIARASIVLCAAAMVQILMVSVLVMPTARLERLLPVMDHGIVPILQGAWSLFGFPYGETILFAILLPAAAPFKKAKRAALVGCLAGVLVLAAVHARNVAVLGEHLTIASRFPTPHRAMRDPVYLHGIRCSHMPPLGPAEGLSRSPPTEIHKQGMTRPSRGLNLPITQSQSPCDVTRMLPPV